MKISPNAQWEYLFLMDFGHFGDFQHLPNFLVQKSIFDGKVIFQLNTIYLRLFLIKECNAIRPGLNCFISMIISIAYSSVGFSLPPAPNAAIVPHTNTGISRHIQTLKAIFHQSLSLFCVAN